MNEWIACGDHEIRWNYTVAMGLRVLHIGFQYTSTEDFHTINGTMHISHHGGVRQ